MNIFEQLVIWLMRHRQVVTISTGIVYNHKMIKLGRYQVVELADDMVVVETEDFNYTARTFEDLKAVVNSIRV